MKKYDVEEIVRDQRAAENTAWDTENNKECWESEEDRQAYLKSCLERLNPINLGQVKLPQLPLVRLDPSHTENQPEWLQKHSSVLCLDRHYVVLGELAQMPGYVVVQDYYYTGKIISGIHIERFELVPTNEA